LGWGHIRKSQHYAANRGGSKGDHGLLPPQKILASLRPQMKLMIKAYFVIFVDALPMHFFNVCDYVFAVC